MIMGMPWPSCDSVSRETGAGLVWARPVLRGDALPLMFVGRVARRRRHEQRSRVHLRADRKQSRHGPSCARQLIAGQPLSPTEGALHGSRLGCFGPPRPWWIFLAGADLLSYEQVPFGQIGRIDLAPLPLGRRPSKSESTVDARPLWLRRCRPGRRDARTSSRFPQATPATGRRELATEPGQLRNRGRTSPASPGSALIPLPTRATSSRIMAAPSLDTHPALQATSGLGRPPAVVPSIRPGGPPCVTYRLGPIWWRGPTPDRPHDPRVVRLVTDDPPVACGYRPANAAVTRRGAPLTSEALLTSSPAARRRILDDQRP